MKNPVLIICAAVAVLACGSPNEEPTPLMGPVGVRAPTAPAAQEPTPKPAEPQAAEPAPPCDKAGTEQGQCVCPDDYKGEPPCPHAAAGQPCGCDKCPSECECKGGDKPCKRKAEGKACGCTDCPKECECKGGDKSCKHKH